MKNLSINYINENGSDGGVVELLSGEYWNVILLEPDQVWAFGVLVNTGLVCVGYFDASDVGKEQGLSELIQDLEEYEIGGSPSGNFHTCED